MMIIRARRCKNVAITRRFELIGSTSTSTISVPNDILIPIHTQTFTQAHMHVRTSQALPMFPHKKNTHCRQDPHGHNLLRGQQTHTFQDKIIHTLRNTHTFASQAQRLRPQPSASTASTRHVQAASTSPTGVPEPQRLTTPFV